MYINDIMQSFDNSNVNGFVLVSHYVSSNSYMLHEGKREMNCVYCWYEYILVSLYFTTFLHLNLLNTSTFLYRKKQVLILSFTSKVFGVSCYDFTKSAKAFVNRLNIQFTHTFFTG